MYTAMRAPMLNELLTTRYTPTSIVTTETVCWTHWGPGDHRTGEQAQARVYMLQKRNGRLPALLHVRLRPLGFHGFHSDEALDQGRVLECACPVGGLGEVAHRSLDQGRVEEDQDGTYRERNRERPGDERDDQKEKEGKGNVHICEQRGRRYEVPNRFEPLNHVGERPHGGRTVRRLQSEDLFHHDRGEPGVRPRGRFVDEMRSRHVEQKIRTHHDENAGCGDPERIHRPVRDDPIVDVHRKKRHRQREDVADRRCRDDVPVDGTVFRDGAPEPAGAPLPVVRGSALVEPEEGFDVKRITRVERLQPGEFDRRLTVAQLRKEDAGDAVLPVHGEQDTGPVLREDEDQGEKGRVELSKGGARDAARHSRLRRGPFEARWYQDIVFERKPGEDPLEGDEQTMNLAYLQEAESQISTLRSVRPFRTPGGDGIPLLRRD